MSSLVACAKSKAAVHRTLTIDEEARLIEYVWRGYDIKTACKMVGLPHNMHLYLKDDIRCFLMDVAMVASARDRGLGILPPRKNQETRFAS